MLNLKQVVWIGDTKSTVAGFPISVRVDFGHKLFLLQKGQFPKESRPMKSVGKGVFELKEADASGWYRVIYTLRMSNKIYILHCFKKKSRKTAREDLDIAKKRFNFINTNTKGVLK